MHADDYSIDEGVFEIWIARHRVENAIKNAVFGPAAKPSEDAVPLAEPRQQVTPRPADAHAPSNHFKKKSIILRRHAAIARIARQQRLKDRPNSIGENKSLRTHCPPKRKFESDFDTLGNPICLQTLVHRFTFLPCLDLVRLWPRYLFS